jgi:hypothetical protein
MTESVRTIDVAHCARCGGDHMGIAVFLFHGRPILDVEISGIIWNQYAYCPETGDPILVRSETTYTVVDVTGDLSKPLFGGGG